MSGPRKSLFSSLASSTEHVELPRALLEWVRSLDSTKHLLSLNDDDDDDRKLDDLKDLMDGVILGNILMEIDSQHFSTLSSSISNWKALTENWVLRFNHLKRLYKLLIRYFNEVLNSSTESLNTPNLQLIAKGRRTSISDEDEGSNEEEDDEICKLIGLVLALAVQSQHDRLKYIEGITNLSEWVQKELMYSIETTMSKIQPIQSTLEMDDDADAADSEFYQLQHEKSRMRNDKEALQTIYEDLLERYNLLKDEHEEALSNAATAESRAIELEKRIKEREASKNEQGYKNEIDKLKSQIQILANQLGETEQNLEHQTSLTRTLSLKIEDLTPLASETFKLKDRLDESKHLKEKFLKMENVLEKYKKKLEETGEWKRMIKTLEDENSELLDKNTTISEENENLSSLKPLLDSSKSRINKLEIQSSSTLKENLELKNQLEIFELKFKSLEEEKERLSLLEERLKEFELGDKQQEENLKRQTFKDDYDEDDDSLDEGFGTELQDALSGTSSTELKLKIRRLERQLKNYQSKENSSERLRVLESSLQDSEKMKERYQKEYLEEVQQRMKFERKLKEFTDKGGQQTRQEEAVDKEDLIQTLQGKLQKAKTFIKQQDKLLKAELSANYEQTLESQSSEIQQLKDSLERQASMSKELERNYRREHELMISAWHDIAMKQLRQQVLSTSSNNNGGAGGEREYQPQSWIKQQRLRANGKPLRQA